MIWGTCRLSQPRVHGDGHDELSRIRVRRRVHDAQRNRSHVVEPRWRAGGDTGRSLVQSGDGLSNPPRPQSRWDAPARARRSHSTGHDVRVHGRSAPAERMALPDAGYSTTRLIVSTGPFHLEPGRNGKSRPFSWLRPAWTGGTLSAVFASGPRCSRVRRLLPIAHPSPTRMAHTLDLPASPLSSTDRPRAIPTATHWTYTWRFGDGAVGNGVRPMHSYASPGVYPVRLTVFDATLGTEDTTSAHVAPVDSASALLTASGPAVRPSRRGPWS